MARYMTTHDSRSCVGRSPEAVRFLRHVGKTTNACNGRRRVLYAAFLTEARATARAHAAKQPSHRLRGEEPGRKPAKAEVKIYRGTFS